MRVVVSELADADTAAILFYLNRQAGYAIAEKYIRAFDELYDRLAAFPNLGAPRPELGPAARICPIAPYIVIYECGNDQVTVLRLLHSHRNITRELLRER